MNILILFYEQKNVNQIANNLLFLRDFFMPYVDRFNH